MSENHVPSNGRSWIGVSVALLIVGGLIAIGVVPRLRHRAAVAETTREAAAPRRVVYSQARRVEGPTQLTLPGSANAFRAAGVFAKASGFVRKVHVDLGDRVRAGQLLVELEIPETDQELHRVRAQVEEAEANVGLYDTNAARTEKLTKDGIVSNLQAEQAKEQSNSARAAAKTNRAELQRLVALQGYQRITAPFAGVISRRLVEPGQLVNVGTGGGSGPGALLMEVSETEKLRVFFDVPQSMAGDIAVGLKASVFVPSLPTQVVEGTILRTSGALDPSTRNLRAEVDIDGRQGILAGAFVSVRLSIPRKNAVITIPASALAIRREGPRVARLEGNKVRWVPITIGRDLSKELEILSGLGDGDKVVLNAPDDLVDGEEVRGTDRGKI